MHDCGRNGFGDDFVEFVDPTLLDTESPDLVLDDHAAIGLFLEGKNNTPAFSKGLQHSTWAEVLPTLSALNGIEDPCHPSEDMSEGLLTDPLAREMLSSQTFNVDSYDGHGSNSIPSCEPSYGFTISSGWSSTFFPCGMDKEPEV